MSGGSGRPNFTFSGDWQQLRIKRRQIEFAWGPTEDKTLREFDRIEFGISAGRDGGKGNLWFDQLSLKVVPPQATASPPIDVRFEHASSERCRRGDRRRGWKPHGAAARGRAHSFCNSICSARRSSAESKSIGSMGLHAARYTVGTSFDGKQWQTVRTVTTGNGKRDSHLLPESEARFIRVVDARCRSAVRRLPSSMFATSTSARHRMHSSKRSRRMHVAAAIRVGTSERASVLDRSLASTLTRKKVSCPKTRAIEARRASFSIEPFIKTQTGLVTWADVTTEHSLAR